MTRYDGIWKIFSIYDHLLIKLEDIKKMAIIRPEPSYYQSYINAIWEKLNKYWSMIIDISIYYAIMVLYPGFGLSYIRGAFLEYNIIDLISEEDYEHRR